MVGSPVGPLEFQWRPRQGKLIVIQPSLDIEMSLHHSVAERSFSLLDRVKVVVKPMAQPLLRNCR